MIIPAPWAMRHEFHALHRTHEGEPDIQAALTHAEWLLLRQPIAQTETHIIFGDGAEIPFTNPLCAACGDYACPHMHAVVILLRAGAREARQAEANHE